MGVSESISVVLLIGFSVDYVIHLSADYMHSSYKSRHDKMKQAYGEMGISILSGAITTFGAGCFVFLCTVKPTQKIAVLITSTIGISFFVAMVLFGAIIHTVGPEDGCGDLLWYLRKKPLPNLKEEM
jgi:predicted RND superfamily exporter protein